jgi:hypothetical protein
MAGRATPSSAVGRRLRWRTTIVLLGGSCAAVLLAPNALWLVRSTARVDNHTNLTLESLQIQVDSAVTSAHDLPGGSSRFLVLPDQGDATFSVQFRIGSVTHRGCRDYVEGDMYHVSVDIEPGPLVRCETTLPILSRLLALELLRTTAEPHRGARAAPFTTGDPLDAFVRERYRLGADYFVKGVEDTDLFRCILEGDADRPRRVAYSEISAWGNRTGPWEVFERHAGGAYAYTETTYLSDTGCLERCASRQYFGSGSCTWARGWPLTDSADRELEIAWR